jgi:hypothetical protein
LGLALKTLNRNRTPMNANQHRCHLRAFREF